MQATPAAMTQNLGAPPAGGSFSPTNFAAPTPFLGSLGGSLGGAQDVPGTLGGPGAAHPTSQSTSQSVSSGGTYFQDPNFVNQMAGSLGGVGQQAASGYLPFVQNPTASPYFQNALQGLLGALAPSEQQARQGLGDQFRSAGMMSSGIFGNQATNLEGQLNLNRGQIASQLLTTMFPQITQALQNPMDQITQLMNAVKLQQQGSQSTSQSVGEAPGQRNFQYTPTGDVGGIGGVQFF